MDEGRQGGPKRRSLFVKDGDPVGFFLHGTIKNGAQRQKLRADIEAYGGRVVYTDTDADTVLVDSKYDKIDFLRDVYNVHDDPAKRKVFVEKMTFVQHCIKYGQFKHRLPIIKGMGGKVGRRVGFTPEDDEHLARYLARKLPDLEAGGRKGEAIYFWLFDVAEVSPEEYSWVYRHTPDSWRERYRKNPERFDERIAEIVEEERPIAQKQRWKEDRRRSRRRKRRIEEEEEEDDDDDEEEEEEDDDDDEEEEEEEEEEEDDEDFVDQGEMEVEEGRDEEMHYQEKLFIEDNPSEDDAEGWDQQELEEDFALEETTKRQKSSTSAHKAVKRRRVDVVEDDPPTQRAGDKGKGKAIISDEEEQEDDGEMHNTSLFSIDDENVLFDDFDVNGAGPSHTLPSPDRTLAEHTTRHQHSPEDIMTQATLVELTVPKIFEPVSHSTSANRRHSGNTTRSLPSSREGALLSPPAAQQPPSQRHTAARKTAQVVRPRSPNLEDLHSQAANYPARRGRPKKRLPLVDVQAKDYEPPYKNTRSRSHSVEPIMLPRPKRKRVTKKKETIPEEVEVEEVDMLIAEAAPTTETQEEEMDVEKLLTPDARQATRNRPPSLETDDAQTRQNLAGSRMFTSHRIKPEVLLRRFDESTKRRSVPPTQQQPPSQPSSENQRLGHIIPQPRHSQMPSEPRTPIAVSRLRGHSTASTESSFPLRGTRASAVKKERREEEKRTPYKPPQGTRAAQYSAMSK